MAKQTKTKGKKKPQKKSVSKMLVENFRRGQSVSLDYFKQNGWLVALVAVIVLSVMGLRNKSKTHMMEITELKRELVRAESEKISEKQKYMTLIRQTRMNELVNENGLGLIHQENPPYEIDQIPEK